MSLLHWKHILYYTEMPLVGLFALALISQIVYVTIFRLAMPSLTSGAAIMALGLYLLICVSLWGFYDHFVVIITIELLIISLYLEIRLLETYLLSGGFANQSFSYYLSVGTWAAGNAVLAILFNAEDMRWRGLHGFTVATSLVAFFLWILYLGIVLRWYYQYWHRQRNYPVTGVLLLSTVSTQSMALLYFHLLHANVMVWVYQGLVLLGYLFYLLGMWLILTYHFQLGWRRLISGWPNVNSIMHGALSISGLAVVFIPGFPNWLINLNWWLALFGVIVVEAIAMSHLWLRLHQHGWRRGIFHYHPSQWARIFTLAMFYLFTANYAQHFVSSNDWVVTSVVNLGAYALTMLILLELMVLAHFYYLLFRRSRLPIGYL